MKQKKKREFENNKKFCYNIYRNKEIRFTKNKRKKNLKIIKKYGIINKKKKSKNQRRKKEKMLMLNKKITKKMVLEAMNVAVRTTEIDFGTDVAKEDVLSYISNAICQIDSKAEKAKERQEKTKKAGDELRAMVKSVLSTSFMTGNDIFEAVSANYDVEELTKPKVTARLSQLVKLGEVKKETAKIDGKRLMTYALVSESKAVEGTEEVIEDTEE